MSNLPNLPPEISMYSWEISEAISKAENDEERARIFQYYLNLYQTAHLVTLESYFNKMQMPYAATITRDVIVGKANELRYNLSTWERLLLSTTPRQKWNWFDGVRYIFWFWIHSPLLCKLGIHGKPSPEDIGYGFWGVVDLYCPRCQTGIGHKHIDDLPTGFSEALSDIVGMANVANSMNSDLSLPDIGVE